MGEYESSHVDEVEDGCLMIIFFFSPQPASSKRHDHTTEFHVISRCMATIASAIRQWNHYWLCSNAGKHGGRVTVAD